MAKRDRSRSGLNVVRVLEAVADLQPCGLSELARATSVAKTSVQRYLFSLEEAGWIEVAPGGQGAWRLTRRIIGIALKVDGVQDLRSAALEVMKELAAETGETIHLSVRDGNELVIVERVDSSQPVRTFVELGTRGPLAVTASGMAILSQLPTEEVAEILAHEISQYTKATITDPAKIHVEIKKAKQQGYAINPGYWRPDVCAVGAAIPVAGNDDHPGSEAAAIVVSLPSARFEKERAHHLGRLAVQAAHKIRLSLGG